MSTPTKPVLHHLDLSRTRLQEMIDWHGEVVGTEVVFRDIVAGMSA